jgi:GTPase SAR1 family protein
LVFDLTNKETLMKLKRIAENLDHNNCPLLLIGNKNDLTKERVVNNDDIENTIQSFKSDGWKIEYYETSAKDPSDKDHILDLLFKIMFNK